MRKIYILLYLALSFFPRQNCSNKIRGKNLMGNSTVLDVAIKRRFDSGNGIAFLTLVLKCNIKCSSRFF